jgi:NADH-quinone oxidoreductase subunit N
MSPDYHSLSRAFSPELALIAGALLLVTVDLAAGSRVTENGRRRIATLIAVLTLGAAGGLTFWVGSVGAVFGGMFSVDTASVAARAGILLLAFLAVGTAGGARALRNGAEYHAIVLFAVCGFMVMATANHLLIAFLALELASLSLYVLVGFDKTRAESAEAGLKYFLYGGMAAAFLLFGFSLLYGLTGSLELSRISAALAFTGLNPLLGVALAMIVVAFGFKTAAAPFHLWAPDAYQGAPLSAAALVASASKLAGLMLFLRLFWSGLRFAAGNTAWTEMTPGWLTVLALLSFLSLVIGNVAALAQSDVRRLLAYSAIAHAGALLLGVMAAGRGGAGPVLYYAITYGIATVGAFGALGVLEAGGGRMRVVDLAGLSRRSPLLAGCFGIFVLSLAGIPPLAGFFGKFAVYAAALDVEGIRGLTGLLALAAIGFSAVALYYYLVLLKQVFVVESQAPTERVRVPLTSGLVLVLAAGLLVALGLFPSGLLQMIG